MTINTGSFPRLLQMGIDKLVQGQYKEHEQEWSQVFDKAMSDKNYDVSVSVGSLGYLSVKPESGSATYDDYAQGFTSIAYHKVYASGLIFSRECMEDNLYKDKLMKEAPLLGRAARITKETVLFDVLNNAFDSTVVFGDGVQLCSTVQPLEDGGTFANRPSTDANLSEAALEQAVLDIEGWVDGRGKPVRVTPDKLIYHYNDQFNAHRILNSTLRVGTAENDVNALRELGMFQGKAVKGHYLDDTNAWFIRTDEPGLIMRQRRPLMVEEDKDFDTHNIKFQIHERYSYDCYQKRSIYGTSGT